MLFGGARTNCAQAARCATPWWAAPARRPGMKGRGCTHSRLPAQPRDLVAAVSARPGPTPAQGGRSWVGALTPRRRRRRGPCPQLPQIRSRYSGRYMHTSVESEAWAGNLQGGTLNTRGAQDLRGARRKMRRVKKRQATAAQGSRVRHCRWRQNAGGPSVGALPAPCCSAMGASQTTRVL